MGGKLKKIQLSSKCGGSGSKLEDQFENCLKMHNFQILPPKFYNRGKFSVQKYVIKGLPAI